MTALHEHLERHDLSARAIAFRRDCPLCRAERVQGQLPSAGLVSPRACAAVTAVVLATSAAVPGRVVADGQGVAVPAPPSPPPPPVATVGSGGGGAAPADSGDGDTGSEPQEHQGTGIDGSDGATREATLAASSTPRGSQSEGGAAAPALRATTDTDATDHTTATGQTPPASPPAGDRSGEDQGHSSSPAEAPATAPTAPAAPPSEDGAATPAGAQPSSSAGAASPPFAATPHRRASSFPRGERSSRAAAHRSSASSAGADGRPGAQSSSRHGTSDRQPAKADPDRPTRSDDAPVHGSGTHVRAATAEVQAADTYRVRPGDSLWRIAALHLGSDATTAQTAQEVNRLWKLNEQRIGTGNPDLIFPGQTLTM
jgi:hypothetical protein